MLNVVSQGIMTLAPNSRLLWDIHSHLQPATIPGQIVLITLLELKETHLGPLASTFSRSPSAATITPDSAKDEKASLASTIPANDNGIGMSWTGKWDRETC